MDDQRRLTTLQVIAISVPVVAAAIYVAALVIVFARAQDRPIAKSFGLLAICVIAWNLSVGLTSVPGFRQSQPVIAVVLHAILLFLPATVLHTARTWSNTTSQWSFRALVATYVACLSLALLQTDELVFEGTEDLAWGSMGRAGPLLPGFVLVLMLAVGIGVKLCRDRLLFLQPEDLVALRARSWVLGAMLALPLGLTNVLVNYGVPILPLGSVGTLWVVGVLSYAVTTHRLVDPNFFALRLGSVVAAATPFLLVALVAWGIAQQLPLGLAVSLFAGALVATASVGLGVFPAVRVQIEQRVECSLFPYRDAARQCLQRFSERVVKLGDPEEMTSQLAATLRESMGVPNVGVFTPTAKKNEFRLSTSPVSDGYSEAIHLKLSGTQNGVAVPGTGGWEVLVPAISVDGPAAVIALGPKASGAAIDDSDRTLLSMVAAQLAVALKNAECVEKIKSQGQEIDQLRCRTEAENFTLCTDPDTETIPEFKDIIGCSAALRETLSRVAKVARTDTSVLILGETGTGKELIARALHNLSDRSSGPLVCVNCPAIPFDLAESELFGCDRGAFTGAIEHRPGKFEFANGGTVFLDEVADLPPGVQVKLLRVLEGHEVQRLGSNRTHAINLRIVSATNRNLLEEVRKGRFREDLYYRISSVPIHVPPLRERAGDVQLLAITFLKRAAAYYQRDVRGISQDAMDALISYSWPGNVRELQHVIERAVLLCSSSVLQIEHLSDLSLEGELGGPHPTTLSAAMREEKLRRVRNALMQTGGNQAAAARLLGMSRSNLARLIKRYGIDPLEFDH